MDLADVTPTIFHVRNRTLILVSFPLVAALCFTRILHGLRYVEPWLNWLVVLVVWLFLFAHALRRRLVLDQNGLEYTGLFTTAHVPWSQVTRLVSRKTLGIWPVEGLEVWFLSPEPEDLFIDLIQFNKFWRSDALGAILRKEPPHLFQH
jgi:hypothetical protein